MKKFFLLFLGCIFLFAGCQMMEPESSSHQDSTPPLGTKGYVTVQFPVPDKNSRAVISFNKNAVSSYLVKLTGIDVEYDESKTADESTAYSVSFSSLDLGEYTIKVYAYNSTTLLDFIEDNITVTAGSNPVNLYFKTKDKILNNSHIVTSVIKNNDDWHQFMVFDDNPTHDYSLKTPDSYFFISSSENLISFAETKDGTIYYSKHGITYIRIYGDNSTTINIPEYSENDYYLTEDSLYYDAFSDKLYALENVYTESPFISLLEINTTEKTASSILSIDVSLFQDIQDVKSFAVCNNDLFIAYERNVSYSEDSYAISRFDMSATSENESNPVVPNATAPVGTIYISDIIDEKFGEISDLQITQPGELYALVRQVGGINKDSTSFDFNELKYETNEPGNKFYSRGGLAKLSYTEGNVISEKTVGWYGNENMRILRQEGTAPEHFSYIAENNEMKELDVYGPSYNENQNYFYGPKKIICIKPKELYIVDCGMAVRLADWKRKNRLPELKEGDKGYGWTEGYDELTGMTSNIFYHSRIVKVNLGDFALDVEEDIINSYKKMYAGYDKFLFENITQDLLQYINISGSNCFGNNNQTTSFYLDIHPAASENPADDDPEGTITPEDEALCERFEGLSLLDAYRLRKRDSTEKIVYLQEKLSWDDEKIENFIAETGITLDEPIKEQYSGLGFTDLQIARIENINNISEKLSYIKYIEDNDESLKEAKVLRQYVIKFGILTEETIAAYDGLGFDEYNIYKLESLSTVVARLNYISDNYNDEKVADYKTKFGIIDADDATLSNYGEFGTLSDDDVFNLINMSSDSEKINYLRNVCGLEENVIDKFKLQFGIVIFDEELRNKYDGFDLTDDQIKSIELMKTGIDYFSYDCNEIVPYLRTLNWNDSQIEALRERLDFEYNGIDHCRTYIYPGYANDTSNKYYLSDLQIFEIETIIDDANAESVELVVTYLMNIGWTENEAHLFLNDRDNTDAEEYTTPGNAG